MSVNSQLNYYSVIVILLCRHLRAEIRMCVNLRLSFRKTGCLSRY